jgi:hypothetical protein
MFPMATDEKTGWRIEPIPTRPAYEDADGNVRVPIWLTNDGRHLADTEMVLRPSEAQLLSDRPVSALSATTSVVQELFRNSATMLAPGVALVRKDSSDGGWRR